MRLIDADALEKDLRHECDKAYNKFCATDRVDEKTEYRVAIVTWLQAIFRVRDRAATAKGETMTDGDLIKALRYCAGKGICDDCPVQNEGFDERMCCDDYLNLLAAARLEELSCHRDSTI